MSKPIHKTIALLELVTHINPCLRVTVWAEYFPNYRPGSMLEDRIKELVKKHVETING